MKRGAIVLAAGPGDIAGKPRPFLVVQANLFNMDHASISLCPITSTVGGEALFRVALQMSDETGLRRESEVQIDKIQSLRRGRIVSVIGRVPPDRMELVDQGLRRWLEL